MVQRRAWLVVSLLVFVILVTTASAGPVSARQAEKATLQSTPALQEVTTQIRLPRLVLTYEQDGVPRIFGARLTTIGNMIGADLSMANLSADMLEQLQSANIQHVEVELAEQGLFVYANGKTLPYVAWDEASLDKAGDLLANLELVPNAAIVDKALLLLPRIGLDIVLQFPVAEGVEAIPLRDRDERLLAEPVDLEPATVITLGIAYTEEGVPSLAGFTTRELESLTGMNLSSLELSPDVLQMLEKAQIDQLEIKTQTDGLYIYLDGDQALHVAFGKDHLMNLLELAQGFLGDNEMLPILSQVISVLYPIDLDIVVEFPTGS